MAILQQVNYKRQIFKFYTTRFCKWVTVGVINVFAFPLYPGLQKAPFSGHGIKGHGSRLFITQLQFLFHHVHVTVSVKYELRKVMFNCFRKMKFQGGGSTYLIKIKCNQVFAFFF